MAEDTQTVAPPQYTPSADETGAFEALKTGPMKSFAGPFERLYKQSQQAALETATSKRKQEETLAKGKSDAAQTMYAGMQEQKTAMDKMAPPPKMNITPDTHEGLMGLATILPIAGLLLGSKGMMSGVNAMNAMTGVMKGYQEGNKARIDFEKQKYDTAMKEWDANYKISRQKLADAIDMMKTNYQVGVAKAEEAAVAMGPEPAALVRQNGAAFLLGKLDEANNHVLAAQEKLSQAAPTPVIDTQTGKSTFATRAQIIENPERYQAASRYMPSSELAYRDWIRPGGAGGKNILGVNTVAQHLNQLEELGKALNNNNIQALNKIANRYSVAVGEDPVTNFNAAKQTVAGEIVRVITQTGGALADRQEAEAVLDAAKSPAQLEGAINTIKNLIGGRINSARYQYEVGTGKKDFSKLLTPDAMKAFGKYVEGQTSEPAAPAETNLDDLLKKYE